MLRALSGKPMKGSNKAIIGSSPARIARPHVPQNVLGGRIIAGNRQKFLTIANGEKTLANALLLNKELHSYVALWMNTNQRTDSVLRLTLKKFMFVHLFNCKVAQVTNVYLIDKNLKDALAGFMTISINVLRNPAFAKNKEFNQSVKDVVIRLLWSFYSKYHYYLKRTSTKEEIWESIYTLLDLELPTNLPEVFNDLLDSVKKSLPPKPVEPQVPYFIENVEAFQEQSMLDKVKEPVIVDLCSSDSEVEETVFTNQSQSAAPKQPILLSSDSEDEGDTKNVPAYELNRQVTRGRRIYKYAKERTREEQEPVSRVSNETVNIAEYVKQQTKMFVDHISKFTGNLDDFTIARVNGEINICLKPSSSGTDVPCGTNKTIQLDSHADNLKNLDNPSSPKLDTPVPTCSEVTSEEKSVDSCTRKEKLVEEPSKPCDNCSIENICSDKTEEDVLLADSEEDKNSLNEDFDEDFLLNDQNGSEVRSIETIKRSEGSTRSQNEEPGVQDAVAESAQIPTPCSTQPQTVLKENIHDQDPEVEDEGHFLSKKSVKAKKTCKDIADVVAYEEIKDSQQNGRTLEELVAQTVNGSAKDDITETIEKLKNLDIAYEVRKNENPVEGMEDCQLKDIMHEEKLLPGLESVNEICRQSEEKLEHDRRPREDLESLNLLASIEETEQLNIMQLPDGNELRPNAQSDSNVRIHKTENNSCTDGKEQNECVPEDLTEKVLMDKNSTANIDGTHKQAAKSDIPVNIKESNERELVQIDNISVKQAIIEKVSDPERTMITGEHILATEKIDQLFISKSKECIIETNIYISAGDNIKDLENTESELTVNDLFDKQTNSAGGQDSLCSVSDLSSNVEAENKDFVEEEISFRKSKMFKETAIIQGANNTKIPAETEMTEKELKGHAKDVSTEEQLSLEISLGVRIHKSLNSIEGDAVEQCTETLETHATQSEESVSKSNNDFAVSKGNIKDTTNFKCTPHKSQAILKTREESNHEATLKSVNNSEPICAENLSKGQIHLKLTSDESQVSLVKGEENTPKLESDETQLKPDLNELIIDTVQTLSVDNITNDSLVTTKPPEVALKQEALKNLDNLMDLPTQDQSTIVEHQVNQANLKENRIEETIIPCESADGKGELKLRDNIKITSSDTARILKSNVLETDRGFSTDNEEKYNGRKLSKKKPKKPVKPTQQIKELVIPNKDEIDHALPKAVVLEDTFEEKSESNEVSANQQNNTIKEPDMMEKSRFTVTALNQINTAGDVATNVEEKLEKIIKPDLERLKEFSKEMTSVDSTKKEKFTEIMSDNFEQNSISADHIPLEKIAKVCSKECVIEIIESKSTDKELLDKQTNSSGAQDNHVCLEELNVMNNFELEDKDFENSCNKGETFKKTVKQQDANHAELAVTKNMTAHSHDVSTEAIDAAINENLNKVEDDEPFIEVSAGSRAIHSNESLTASTINFAVSERNINNAASNFKYPPDKAQTIPETKEESDHKATLWSADSEPIASGEHLSEGQDDLKPASHERQFSSVKEENKPDLKADETQLKSDLNSQLIIDKVQTSAKYNLMDNSLATTKPPEVALENIDNSDDAVEVAPQDHPSTIVEYQANEADLNFKSTKEIVPCEPSDEKVESKSSENIKSRASDTAKLLEDNILEADKSLSRDNKEKSNSRELSRKILSTLKKPVKSMQQIKKCDRVIPDKDKLHHVIPKVELLEETFEDNSESKEVCADQQNNAIIDLNVAEKSKLTIPSSDHINIAGDVATNTDHIANKNLKKNNNSDLERLGEFSKEEISVDSIKKDNMSVTENMSNNFERNFTSDVKIWPKEIAEVCLTKSINLLEPSSMDILKKETTNIDAIKIHSSKKVAEIIKSHLEQTINIESNAETKNTSSVTKNTNELILPSASPYSCLVVQTTDEITDNNIGNDSVQTLPSKEQVQVLRQRISNINILSNIVVKKIDHTTPQVEVTYEEKPESREVTLQSNTRLDSNVREKSKLIVQALNQLNIHGNLDAKTYHIAKEDLKEPNKYELVGLHNFSKGLPSNETTAANSFENLKAMEEMSDNLRKNSTSGDSISPKKIAAVSLAENTMILKCSPLNRFTKEKSSTDTIKIHSSEKHTEKGKSHLKQNTNIESNSGTEKTVSLTENTKGSSNKEQVLVDFSMPIDVSRPTAFPLPRQRTSDKMLSNVVVKKTIPYDINKDPITKSELVQSSGEENRNAPIILLPQANKVCSKEGLGSLPECETVAYVEGFDSLTPQQYHSIEAHVNKYPDPKEYIQKAKEDSLSDISTLSFTTNKQQLSLNASIASSEISNIVMTSSFNDVRRTSAPIREHRTSVDALLAASVSAGSEKPVSFPSVVNYSFINQSKVEPAQIPFARDPHCANKLMTLAVVSSLQYSSDVQSITDVTSNSPDPSYSSDSESKLRIDEGWPRETEEKLETPKEKKEAKSPKRCRTKAELKFEGESFRVLKKIKSSSEDEVPSNARNLKTQRGRDHKSSILMTHKSTDANTGRGRGGRQTPRKTRSQSQKSMGEFQSSEASVGPKEPEAYTSKLRSRSKSTSDKDKNIIEDFLIQHIPAETLVSKPTKRKGRKPKKNLEETPSLVQQELTKSEEVPKHIEEPKGVPLKSVLDPYLTKKMVALPIVPLKKRYLQQNPFLENNIARLKKSLENKNTPSQDLKGVANLPNSEIPTSNEEAILMIGHRANLISKNISELNADQHDSDNTRSFKESLKCQAEGTIEKAVRQGNDNPLGQNLLVSIAEVIEQSSCPTGAEPRYDHSIASLLKDNVELRRSSVEKHCSTAFGVNHNETSSSYQINKHPEKDYYSTESESCRNPDESFFGYEEEVPANLDQKENQESHNKVYDYSIQNSQGVLEKEEIRDHLSQNPLPEANSSDNNLDGNTVVPYLQSTRLDATIPSVTETDNFHESVSVAALECKPTEAKSSIASSDQLHDNQPIFQPSLMESNTYSIAKTDSLEKYSVVPLSCEVNVKTHQVDADNGPILESTLIRKNPSAIAIYKSRDNVISPSFESTSPQETTKPVTSDCSGNHSSEVPKVKATNPSASDTQITVQLQTELKNLAEEFTDKWISSDFNFSKESNGMVAVLQGASQTKVEIICDNIKTVGKQIMEVKGHGNKSMRHKDDHDRILADGEKVPKVEINQKSVEKYHKRKSKASKKLIVDLPRSREGSVDSIKEAFKPKAQVDESFKDGDLEHSSSTTTDTEENRKITGAVEKPCQKTSEGRRGRSKANDERDLLKADKNEKATATLEKPCEKISEGRRGRSKANDERDLLKAEKNEKATATVEKPCEKTPDSRRGRSKASPCKQQTDVELSRQQDIEPRRGRSKTPKSTPEIPVTLLDDPNRREQSRTPRLAEDETKQYEVKINEKSSSRKRKTTEKDQSIDGKDRKKIKSDNTEKVFAEISRKKNGKQHQKVESSHKRNEKSTDLKFEAKKYTEVKEGANKAEKYHEKQNRKEDEKSMIALLKETKSSDIKHGMKKIEGKEKTEQNTHIKERLDSSGTRHKEKLKEERKSRNKSSSRVEKKAEEDERQHKEDDKYIKIKDRCSKDAKIEESAKDKRTKELKSVKEDLERTKENNTLQLDKNRLSHTENKKQKSKLKEPRSENLQDNLEDGSIPKKILDIGVAKCDNKADSVNVERNKLKRNVKDDVKNIPVPDTSEKVKHKGKTSEGVDNEPKEKTSIKIDSCRKSSSTMAKQSKNSSDENIFKLETPHQDKTSTSKIKPKNAEKPKASMLNRGEQLTKTPIKNYDDHNLDSFKNKKPVEQSKSKSRSEDKLREQRKQHENKSTMQVESAAKCSIEPTGGFPSKIEKSKEVDQLNEPRTSSSNPNVISKGDQSVPNNKACSTLKNYSNSQRADETNIRDKKRQIFKSEEKIKVAASVKLYFQEFDSKKEALTNLNNKKEDIKSVKHRESKDVFATTTTTSLEKSQVTEKQMYKVEGSTTPALIKVEKIKPKDNCSSKPKNIVPNIVGKSNPIVAKEKELKSASLKQEKCTPGDKEVSKPEELTSVAIKSKLQGSNSMKDKEIIPKKRKVVTTFDTKDVPTGEYNVEKVLKSEMSDVKKNNEVELEVSNIKKTSVALAIPKPITDTKRYDIANEQLVSYSNKTIGVPEAAGEVLGIAVALQESTLKKGYLRPLINEESIKDLRPNQLCEKNVSTVLGKGQICKVRDSSNQNHKREGYAVTIADNKKHFNQKVENAPKVDYWTSVESEQSKESGECHSTEPVFQDLDFSVSHQEEVNDSFRMPTDDHLLKEKTPLNIESAAVQPLNAKNFKSRHDLDNILMVKCPQSLPQKVPEKSSLTTSTSNLSKFEDSIKLTHPIIGNKSDILLPKISKPDAEGSMCEQSQESIKRASDASRFSPRILRNKDKSKAPKVKVTAASDIVVLNQTTNIDITSTEQKRTELKNAHYIQQRTNSGNNDRKLYIVLDNIMENVSKEASRKRRLSMEAVSPIKKKVDIFLLPPSEREGGPPPLRFTRKISATSDNTERRNVKVEYLPNLDMQLLGNISAHQSLDNSSNPTQEQKQLAEMNDAFQDAHLYYTNPPAPSQSHAMDQQQFENAYGGALDEFFENETIVANTYSGNPDFDINFFQGNSSVISSFLSTLDHANSTKMDTSANDPRISDESGQKFEHSYSSFAAGVVVKECGSAIPRQQSREQTIADPASAFESILNEVDTLSKSQNLRNTGSGHGVSQIASYDPAYSEGNTSKLPVQSTHNMSSASEPPKDSAVSQTMDSMIGGCSLETTLDEANLQDLLQFNTIHEHDSKSVVVGDSVEISSTLDGTLDEPNALQALFCFDIIDNVVTRDAEAQLNTSGKNEKPKLNKQYKKTLALGRQQITKKPNVEKAEHFIPSRQFSRSRMKPPPRKENLGSTVSVQSIVIVKPPSESLITEPPVKQKENVQKAPEIINKNVEDNKVAATIIQNKPADTVREKLPKESFVPQTMDSMIGGSIEPTLDTANLEEFFRCDSAGMKPAGVDDSNSIISGSLDGGLDETNLQPLFYLETGSSEHGTDLQYADLKSLDIIDVVIGDTDENELNTSFDISQLEDDSKTDESVEVPVGEQIDVQPKDTKLEESKTFETEKSQQNTFAVNVINQPKKSAEKRKQHEEGMKITNASSRTAARCKPRKGSPDRSRVRVKQVHELYPQKLPEDKQIDLVANSGASINLDAKPSCSRAMGAAKISQPPWSPLREGTRQATKILKKALEISQTETEKKEKAPNEGSRDRFDLLKAVPNHPLFDKLQREDEKLTKKRKRTASKTSPGEGRDSDTSTWYTKGSTCKDKKTNKSKSEPHQLDFQESHTVYESGNINWDQSDTDTITNTTKGDPKKCRSDPHEPDDTEDATYNRHPGNKSKGYKSDSHKCKSEPYQPGFDESRRSSSSSKTDDLLHNSEENEQQSSKSHPSSEEPETVQEKWKKKQYSWLETFPELYFHRSGNILSRDGTSLKGSTGT